jgi:hypothetical protein
MNVIMPGGPQTRRWFGLTFDAKPTSLTNDQRSEYGAGHALDRLAATPLDGLGAAGHYFFELNAKTQHCPVIAGLSSPTNPQHASVARAKGVTTLGGTERKVPCERAVIIVLLQDVDANPRAEFGCSNYYN